LLVLYPWVVSYAPVDSLVTEIGLSLGAGKEVRITRDCDGRIISKDELPFTNYAVSASHQVSSDITLGLAGGYANVRDNGDWLDIPFDTSENSRGFRNKTVIYAKPKVSFDWRYFGFSAGGLVSTPSHEWADGLGFSPIGSMRIGSREGFALETHVMDHDLLVGPGWVYSGFAIAFPVGVEKKRYARWHVGIGGGPIEAGFQMHAEIPFETFTIEPGFVFDLDGTTGFGLFAKIRYRIEPVLQH
jgi:hypothetical protein